MAFEEVPSRVEVDKFEREVLRRWQQERVFERTLEKTKDGPLYTFYDGPPYATGKPHYGHILQSAIKDTVLRYKTMRGYYVPRRVGWDCHGLPVETIVEKELGFKSKKDIERFGIERFNQKCREAVVRYIDVFTETLKRMGRWADYENAYFTLDRDYMESEWWVFKQLWDLGLVYQDFRSTPYCIRCETPLSNFEVSMAYKDKTDTAVHILLKAQSPKPKAQNGGELYLLVWTTTPWTLPGNMAVAINPAMQYVSVEHEGRELVVAKERLAATFGAEAKVVREWSADELRTLKYILPFSPDLGKVEQAESAGTVVFSDHVTTEDGTGLVHIAPAFGEEDARVGKEHKLPTLRTVGTDGRFTKEVPQWAGEHIFEANEKIVDELDKRGLLFKKEHYTHSYPFCWRCDTPLIYYALDSWFVRVAKLKARMLETNKQINWTPKHVRQGRFGKGIESAPDWAVSRNRYWSVPMPVWQCTACEEKVCVGSVAELAQLAGTDEVVDIHRPYVDQLTWVCSACGGAMRRVPEVLDVWFDSGSMPYSQWHYPFENKDFVEQGFPADFIAESIEQTRAWFYTLHVLAAALTSKESKLELGIDQPAYKNVIASGLIFAENGQKLSKKLKNYPEPEPTIKKYGADVLRLYLLSSTSLGEPYRFSEKELQQLSRQVYLTLWNVYSFFVRYANVHDWEDKNAKRKTQNAKLTTSSVLDRWILARMAQLERDVTAALDAYRVDRAARGFAPFVDDLSNWYVRRSRSRFHPSASLRVNPPASLRVNPPASLRVNPPASSTGSERASSEQRRLADSGAAFGVLHEVLMRTATLLAPFMPFVADAMYRNLTGNESVHLEKLPEPAAARAAEKDLLAQVAAVREIVSEGLALRAANGIKVRQPLAQLAVAGEPVGEELAAMVREEVNVRSLDFVETLPDGADIAVSGKESRVRAALNTVITPQLKREGLAREIIRHGQVLRREAGYALNDRITLVFDTEEAELAAVLDEHRELILDALQADTLVAQADAEDAGKDLTLAGQALHLGVVHR